MEAMKLRVSGVGRCVASRRDTSHLLIQAVNHLYVLCPSQSCDHWQARVAGRLACLFPPLSGPSSPTERLDEALSAGGMPGVTLRKRLQFFTQERHGDFASTADHFALYQYKRQLRFRWHGRTINIEQVVIFHLDTFTKTRS